jgi:hypothetical protein
VDALTMMGPAPLAYFLPAFLVAAIQRPSSAAAESLVYFVVGPIFDDTVSSLSRPQHKAVLDTVETILDVDHGFFADQTEAFLRRVDQYADAANKR